MLGGIQENDNANFDQNQISCVKSMMRRIVFKVHVDGINGPT